MSNYQIFLSLSLSLQDHHDDIRQEQKWEMQALSSTQSGSNGSPDDSNEHSGNDSAAGDTGTTAESTSCVESSTGSSQHINNNTIAINNNNCDTIKNNNQAVTAVTPLEISTVVNEVEAVPAVALIEQQSALLRGVNIGKRIGNKQTLGAVIIIDWC